VGDAFVRLSDIQPLAKTMHLAQSIDVMAERRIYLKRIFEQIDLVIAPSQFVLDKISEYGLNARHAVYLPFGLENVSASNGSQARPPSNTLRIGYLGQIAPHKGVHILLDAFRKVVRRHPKCELVLHGRITHATAYERKLQAAAKTHAAITFAGPYLNANVGEILSALDVIVVPSIWYENRPTVIVEAQAARTPVIASRLGGMAELIHHEENGLLFEAGNSDSLATQLQRLIDEPTLLPRLRNGIEPVPDIVDEIATLTALFDDILATTVS
jgi:glycosyltransferase involved in cell wall biosynthesis